MITSYNLESGGHVSFELPANHCFYFECLIITISPLFPCRETLEEMKDHVPSSRE
jgi:hypothetical protein